MKNAIMIFLLALFALAILAIGRSCSSANASPKNIYWVAECPRLPVDIGDRVGASLIVRKRVKRDQVTIYAVTKKTWLTASALRIGSITQGWHVLIWHSPSALYDYVAYNGVCRNVTPWKDLTGAAKQWVATRSICQGVATLAGLTLTSWPCSWQDPTAVRIDRIVPYVYQGE